MAFRTCVSPTTLQNHHHLHHSSRLPAKRNQTHLSSTISTKISANPTYRLSIITNFHMAKARRSKTKAKSRVYGVCNPKPNRSESVQIWTWKNRSTIGDGRKQAKATGSAQGGEIAINQKTTLFATFWKGAAESNRLKSKLKTEWQHIKGEFQLIDRANNWYEVKFSNPIDRQSIWDHRPYYAFGNLLVLVPWKTNFDPLTMSLKTIDVWVRILFLPTEYITSEIVAAIIEHNNIGDFIRLDPYTENRTRTKYARVCVAINCVDKPKNFVVIPNANGDYKVFKLWFEGVSEGCANCGAEEHQFELCPLRMTRNKAKEGKKEKNLVQDNASDIHFSEESSVDKGKQKMEWNEVRYKKGRNQYSIHLEKGSNNINEMNNDIYQQSLQEWPQGLDLQHQMKEGNIQLTEPMLNQQILPQNEEWRGIEENMSTTRKTEEMEAESFKTGIGPTTLTQGMEAIQVTEDNKQNKKQKRGNRMEAASSSSKRSKTSN